MNDNSRGSWPAGVAALALLAVAIAILVHAIRSDQAFGIPGWLLRIAEIALAILIVIWAGDQLGKRLKRVAMVVQYIIVEAPKRSVLVPSLLGLLSSQSCLELPRAS